MKLQRYPKRFTTLVLLLGLACAFGLINSVNSLIHGLYIPLAGLTIVLCLLGMWAMVLYFIKRKIHPWMFYLWIIPQLFLFTINTYDHIHKTVEMKLVYATMLLPNISVNLAWEIGNNSYFLANLHILAFVYLLVFSVVLGSFKDGEFNTEEAAL